MLISKKCSKCEIEKPFKDFRKRSASKDGLKAYCKVCDDAYQRARYNKEPNKMIKNATEWQAANPEKHSQHMKKYRNGGAAN